VVNLDVKSCDKKQFYIQKTTIRSNENIPVKSDYFMYWGTEHIQVLTKSDMWEFH